LCFHYSFHSPFISLFFFFILPPPPTSTLFPYTTLSDLIVLALARIAEATGNPQEANSLYAQFLQIAPADLRAYTYFGRFLIGQHQYQQADTLSALALEKAPRDPGVMALRGQILDMQGQSEEGLSLLETAFALDPN